MRMQVRRVLGSGTIAALLAAAGAAAPAAAQEPAKTPTARGTGGAAATVDVLASQAAIEMLRDGGNAVDAAVAAAGVLGVTEPFSCGIGGGGFMVIRTPDGKVTTIDSREKSPRAMRPDSFIENGRPLSFNDARFSGLSAGVPGTPLGWARALRLYGTVSLEEALEPGIRVARRGFTVDQTFFAQVEAAKDYFDDVPSTRALYLDPDGSPRNVGAVIRNPDMARTYERMADRGVRRGFYRGPVAQAMVAAATRPPIDPEANHVWRPGLMTADDLRRYTAPEREPTRSTYRGLDVYGMGPPSSGGTTVQGALNILEGFSPLAGASRAELLHRYIEASRIAFADRNAFLADPVFFDVPVAGLLSKSFATERRALIGERAGTGAVAAGNPYDDVRPAANSATVSHPGQSTTHLSVADRRGTVVSYTFTIESTGGNGIVVPGHGFLLNNELTDFNFDSTTHPNRAESSKRPRSSMSPTIVERNGRPFLAVGSPGGATIITTVLQVLVNRIDLREPLPNALALPRASQRGGASTEAEAEFIATQEGADLGGLYGHRFNPSTALGGIGAVAAVEIKPGNRFVAAAEATRRGGGSALVVRGER
jgi:gamma-glutamyltranspeptidase/glutathione hydrolase